MLILQLFLFIIILPIAVLALGTFLGLLFKGFDRRIAAYYQSRIGPPIMQPFYDLRKLMMKQNIVPENAVKWIFNGAPLLAMASSVLLLFMIWLPYFANMFGLDPIFMNIGDTVLILYTLMIPAICMIIGGFASGSPYAAIGSQRETVILMSTELPLAIVIVTLGWKISLVNPTLPAFSLVTLTNYPILETMGPLGVIGTLMLLFTLLVIIPAELAKIPFDQAEAETEIAEGLLAEYSGKNLAFFQLAEGVKSLAFASLVIIMFIPQGFEKIFGIKALLGSFDITPLLDIIIFFIKLSIVYLISVITVRVGMARLKIAQVAKIFLITLGILGIAGYIFIVLDTIKL